MIVSGTVSHVTCFLRRWMCRLITHPLLWLPFSMRSFSEVFPIHFLFDLTWQHTQETCCSLNGSGVFLPIVKCSFLCVLRGKSWRLSGESPVAGTSRSEGVRQHMLGPPGNRLRWQLNTDRCRSGLCLQYVPTVQSRPAGYGYAVCCLALLQTWFHACFHCRRSFPFWQNFLFSCNYGEGLREEGLSQDNFLANTENRKQLSIP